MADEKSKKITVRISDTMKTALQNDVMKCGYGFHGKSRWLSEAVSSFLQVPSYVDLVENGECSNQAQLTSVEAFYVPISLISKLKKAQLEVRKNNPLLEGVQSAIIRASVVNRLMNIDFNKICPQGKMA